MPPVDVILLAVPDTEVTVPAIVPVIVPETTMLPITFQLPLNPKAQLLVIVAFVPAIGAETYIP